jgi:hypothetical protein
VRYGKPLTLELRLNVAADVSRFAVMVGFYDVEMKMVAQSVSLNQGVVFAPAGAPMAVIQMKLDQLQLNRGRYRIDCIVLRTADDTLAITQRMARVQNALELQVVSETLRMGASPIQLKAEWRYPEREPKEWAI